MCKIIRDVVNGLFYPDKTIDVMSPKDRIKDKDLGYLPSSKLLTVKLPAEPWITPVANTKSMDPVIDAVHTAILEPYPLNVDGYRKGDLIVGDIVGYAYYTSIILHRIIDIDETVGGERVYTCRGDNTAGKDPYAIIDEYIKWVMVGALY